MVVTANDIAPFIVPVWIIITVICSTMTVLVGIEMYFQRSRIRAQLVYIFMMLLMFSPLFGMWATFAMDIWDGPTAPNRCNISAYIGFIGYIYGNVFLYLYLYERMRLARPNTSPNALERLLLFATYCIIFCLPPIILMSASGYVIQERICAYRIEEWVSAMFIIADSTLSAGFIYMFYTTLRNHLLATSSSVYEGQERLLKTMKSNLKWSSIAIGSTFVHLSIVTLSNVLFSSAPAKFAVLLSCLAADILCNIVSVLACSRLWRKEWPDRLRRLFNGPEVLTHNHPTNQSTEDAVLRYAARQVKHSMLDIEVNSGAVALSNEQ